MEAYDNFRYYFPPRPSLVMSSDAILNFENMGFWGQAKLNGSCSVTDTDGSNAIIMNRHRERFKNMGLNMVEIAALHRGKGLMKFTGEYMNKSQRDANGKIFNQKLCIFDIMVFENQYLTGTTYKERQDLIDEIFVTTPFDPWMNQISENVFRIINHKEDLTAKWKEVSQHEMYEGMVFKKPTGKLEAGTREANNTGWQSKCRKPTKNYSY